METNSWILPGQRGTAFFIYRVFDGCPTLRDRQPGTTGNRWKFFLWFICIFSVFDTCMSHPKFGGGWDSLGHWHIIGVCL